jgi:dUTP pyrophosphatase
VNISITRFASDLPLPSYATPGSAGLDLLAAIDKQIRLLPGNIAAVPTGIAIALPDGYEAQVRPKSGLALCYGVTVLNAPGTIDSDYRGEIAVILVNHGRIPFPIERGMKIAQLVVSPVTRIEWCETAALDETERGAGGFGSTGRSV